MKTLRALWRWLRAVSGDDGYERYLAHHAAAHPDCVPLDRGTWYREHQAAAWARVKRCC